MLDKLRMANRLRQIEWDGGDNITPLYSAIEFAGEVGELLNVMKKIERHRIGLRGSKACQGDLEDEMADVLITLDLLAMRMNIDLTAAVKKKFNATSDNLGLKTKI